MGVSLFKVVKVLGQSGEMSSARDPLTPEQVEAKRAQHEANRAGREAHMQVALGLTEQQIAQIAAIREGYEPQKESLRAQKQALRDGGATRAEIKAAMAEEEQALRDQVNWEIRAVLTPEQVQQMEALKINNGGRKKGGGRHGRDG